MVLLCHLKQRMNIDKNKCIKGCVKPESIHKVMLLRYENALRQVIDGQDKYFRMCSKVCLSRDHKDYINYDKSGPDRDIILLTRL